MTDFVNESMGPSARVAVETSLDAAKALQAALTRAIEQTEEVEGIRIRNTG